MSTSSSTAPDGRSFQDIWSSAAPYVIPPCAASAAIIPVFYGFIAKSAQQVGDPVPHMSIKEGLKKGCKAAPTLGGIIGTQMVVQHIVEKCLIKYSNDPKPETPTFISMLASSTIVAGVSVPALAVFNGLTRERTPIESLKLLSTKQACAIITRETSFLFALRASEPVSDLMKRRFGKNKGVEYGSAFATGTIGSLIGHPADTALTLWQEGKKIENFRQTMRGAPMKAMSVGMLTVCYKITEELLESTVKK